MRVTPRAITKVVFGDGAVKRPEPVRRTRGIPKDVASEVNRILQADIKGGTASSANFGCPAGGKTGTTDGPSDVWLAGYTPRMATAVWVGYPGSRKTIVSTTQAGGNIQGASVSAPIWKEYMASAHGDYCGDFQGLVPFTGTKGRKGSATGGEGSGTITNPDGSTSTTQSGTTGTDGTSTGGTGAYPADQYESPVSPPAP
jgi:penicillin-binding protein 1A